MGEQLTTRQTHALWLVFLSREGGRELYMIVRPRIPHLSRTYMATGLVMQNPLGLP